MRFALIRDKNRINPSSPPLPSSTYSLLPFRRNPHFGWGPYKGLGPWHALILVCLYNVHIILCILILHLDPAAISLSLPVLVCVFLCIACTRSYNYCMYFMYIHTLTIVLHSYVTGVIICKYLSYSSWYHILTYFLFGCHIRTGCLWISYLLI